MNSETVADPGWWFTVDEKLKPSSYPMFDDRTLIWEWAKIVLSNYIE